MMRWIVFVAALALAAVRVTEAQVGVTICACQPDFYEFTLNFTLTCNDKDITNEMPGINDTTCRVSPVGSQNLTDQVPVVVTSVQILELGPPPTYPTLFSTTIPLELSDGGKFNYTSVAAKPQDITPETVPSGLQLSITGRNQNEEEVLNYWLIVYDNDCGIWPLLEEGQKIGWTVFTGLGVPSQFICPAAPSDVTGFPSASPSSAAPAPAAAPTMPPQGAPVTPEPSIGGPTSSKDMPTTSPTVSCPPIKAGGGKPTGGQDKGKGAMGMGKGGGSDMGSRRGRLLKVGPHAPPSACPEPAAPTKPSEPTKPKPTVMKQTMKKAMGDGGGGTMKMSKLSESDSMLHSRSRRRRM